MFVHDDVSAFQTVVLLAYAPRDNKKIKSIKITQANAMFIFVV